MPFRWNSGCCDERTTRENEWGRISRDEEEEQGEEARNEDDEGGERTQNDFKIIIRVFLHTISRLYALSFLLEFHSYPD